MKHEAISKPKLNVGVLLVTVALAAWSLVLFSTVQASHAPDGLADAVKACRDHAEAIGKGWRYDDNAGCEIKF